jgi:DNA-binding MarR family transcriptional regulator
MSYALTKPGALGREFTAIEAALLWYLHIYGQTYRAKCAKALGVNTSTLANAWNNLESLGMIDRSVEGANRRVVWLRLSNRGKQVIRRSRAWKRYAE